MMRALETMDVRVTLRERIVAGVPFLGICLGLHALFESSEEAPGQEGLSIFPGTVHRFSGDARVPHMGWNNVTAVKTSRLLHGMEAHPYVYFAHSYYVPETSVTAATCTYSVPYTAILESGNTFGVQFHPEKSGPVGIQIVRNFLGS
jgi:imidazole glycerol phosphate synthase glutamine amidotransferase subunit